MFPIALQSDPSFNPTQGILPYPQIITIGAPSGHELLDFYWTFSREHSCQCFEVNWHDFLHFPGNFLHKLRLEIEASFCVSKSPITNSFPTPMILQKTESTSEMKKPLEPSQDLKNSAENNKLSGNLSSIPSTVIPEVKNVPISEKLGNSPAPMQLFLISIDKLLNITQKIENIQFIEGHLLSSSSLIMELCELLAGITWPSNSLCIIVYDINNSPLLEPHQFDFNMILGLPDNDARKTYFEQLLTFLPSTNLDLEYLTLHSKNWSFTEIRVFLRNCVYLWNSTHPIQKINSTAEKMSMQFLIEQFEQIEQLKQQEVKRAIQQGLSSIKSSENVILQDNDTVLPDQSTSNSLMGAFTVDFEDQLYQLAAGKEYDTIVLILDKLTKGIILQPQERRIIADYAFMIREDPQKALHKINQMKLRLEKIKPLKNGTKTKKDGKDMKDSKDPKDSQDNCDSKEIITNQDLPPEPLSSKKSPKI